MAAALAAWWIGKITLGLRTDYLAIATLGISEIILYVLKNEDWFVSGLKIFMEFQGLFLMKLTCKSQTGFKM